MIETKTRIIDGNEYAVTQFPASEGLSVLSSLTQIFGESLGRTETGMGDAAEALVKQLEKRNVVALVNKLIGKNVKVNGEPLQGENAFDFHFAGKYKHLAEVIMFVLEANYEDFLLELKDALRAALLATIFRDQKMQTTGDDNSDTSDAAEETTQSQST